MTQTVEAPGVEYLDEEQLEKDIPCDWRNTNCTAPAVARLAGTCPVHGIKAYFLCKEHLALVMRYVLADNIKCGETIPTGRCLELIRVRGI